MALYKGMQLRVESVDSEHRGYFEAARRGELVVQRCSVCAKLRTPIGAACPYCRSLEWAWHPVSGLGTIHSFAIVTRAINPAFANWVPYPIVLVELDEQKATQWPGDTGDERVSLRLVTNLVSRDDVMIPEAEEAVAIGRRVEACFCVLDDAMALPQFHLAGGQ